MISHCSRLPGDLAIIISVVASNIAHHALFTWANSTIVSKRWNLALAMEPSYLQLAKLDIEVCDEVFKNVTTLSHQFRSLLVGQHFLHILIRLLKVREEKDEDFLWIARDLNKINDIVDLMEVSVQNLSCHIDASIIVSNHHWWRSFLGHNIDFVGTRAIEVCHASHLYWVLVLCNAAICVSSAWDNWSELA